MNFKNLSKVWLDEKKRTVKESTFCLYRYEVEKYLVPLFGKISVRKINQEVARKKFDSLQNGARKLSRGTIQNLVTLFRQMMYFAAEENQSTEKRFRINLPRENSLNGTDGENCEKSAIPVLSENNQKRLIEKILEEPNNVNFGILLSLFTGIRIGELCALRWEDFDFKEKILHIRKTLQRVYTKSESGKSTRIIVTPPKSRNSIRSVPLPDSIISFYYIAHKSASVKLCGFITTGEEKYMEPRVMRNHYRRICRDLDIEGFNFHALRHTFATRCVEYGVDCKTLSEILGHSSVSITLNRYVHPSLAEKRKCMNMVASRNLENTAINIPKNSDFSRFIP